MSFKITVFVSALLLFSISAFAQDTASFKLNAYFKKEKNTKYIQYIRKMQRVDTVWSFHDYSLNNHLIQKGFFTDTTCTVAFGHFEFYQYDSKLYEGDYINGKPAGFWYFYKKSSEVSDSLYYAYKKPTVQLPTPIKTSQQQKETELKNEHLKKDTSAPIITVEKFPEFPGGLPAWRQHLQKNLFIPELVMETSPYSKGTVYVQFVVCKDGEVCSIEALNSVHPLADLIAVKAIRKGPRWEPAVQNGKEVKAFQRQPITFIFGEY
jgi:periplasmic protein TonB